MNNSSATRGFTLLEIIITMSIIVGITAMVIPRISKRNNEARALVRKLSVIGRELRSMAKLNNATYRLVINMAEKDNKPFHQYWVEKAQGEVLNDYDAKNPPKLLTAEEEAKKIERDEATPSLFAPDPKIMKKAQTLPGDLIFESVELATAKEPITSNLVYIHYLPSGFADEAAIHLKQTEKNKWTLYTQSLTGNVLILTEFRSLKDIRSK